MADDDDTELFEKVQTLGDLELALLLSLISAEHCILSTAPDSVDALIEELRLVCEEGLVKNG
jgi:hypothetical protein